MDTQKKETAAPGARKTVRQKSARECCEEFIRGNIDNGITPADIADYMGYSVWHFCRMFSDWYGVPPARYMRGLRLESGRERLFSGSSVQEAADAAGFESASGFSRAFYRKYGVTPANLVNDRKLSPGRS